MHMESLEKARQVWQRVQDRGTPPLLRRDPVELLGLSRQQEGLYSRLGQGMPGQAPRFRDYARQSRRWGDCIRGSLRLAERHPREVPMPVMPPEPAGEMLKRALAGERQLLGELNALKGEGDLVRVWEVLEVQAANRCAGLLELLGQNAFPSGGAVTEGDR